jgi:carbon storage regulator
MLVLTRKVGERIVVGDDIEITVVSLRRDQVRLAIAAPRCVSVYRGELVERVRAENAAAARGAALVRAGEAEQVAVAAGALKLDAGPADNDAGDGNARVSSQGQERRPLSR